MKFTLLSYPCESVGIWYLNFLRIPSLRNCKVSVSQPNCTFATVSTLVLEGQTFVRTHVLNKGDDREGPSQVCGTRHCDPAINWVRK